MRRFLRSGALSLLPLLLCTLPAWAQAKAAPEDSVAAPSFLRPGDVVKLDIWREPDLTGEFEVGEDGVVVLPKIGRYTVTGQPPEALEHEILTAYQKYLRNPSIKITFMRRVTILGAVLKPGPYPVSPTMTVADALGLAGGVTPQGASDRVELLRDGQKLETVLSEHTRIADSPIRSGDQLYVPERSWISRNTGIVATIISAATSLTIALLLH